MSINCVVCGLVNPSNATRCDCGYVFAGPAAKVIRVASLESTQRFPLLGVLGILIMLAGLYCLLNPTPLNATAETRVANLQLLTIGETLTLAGTILIGAQWRPR